MGARKHMNEKTRPLVGIRAVEMTNQMMWPAIGGGLRAHVMKAEAHAAAARAARLWGRWA